MPDNENNQQIMRSSTDNTIVNVKSSKSVPMETLHAIVSQKIHLNNGVEAAIRDLTVMVLLRELLKIMRKKNVVS